MSKHVIKSTENYFSSILKSKRGITPTKKLMTLKLDQSFEFIGVLRHMQRYFSHICEGTDVQADWISCTYGRAPNAIDISQGSLTCPSYTDTGPPFIYGHSGTPPHLVAFYDTLGIRRTYSRLKPPASSRELICSRVKQSHMQNFSSTCQSM